MTRCPDILLAMSGGVDSSVCAALLKERGYRVSGLYIIFSDAHAEGISAAECAAKELQIPLHVRDLRKEFEELVLSDFCSNYARGRTPNPCVLCNPAVKFSALLSLADSLYIEKVASGHYARIVRQELGYAVSVAACTDRDQSYMLSRLTQEQLARIELPLGDLDKQFVRKKAEALGLSCSDAPDSEDLCFIPGGDYRTFLRERNVSGLPGRLIGPKGETLRTHDGFCAFTVGQRKGLGISYEYPLYVQRIDSCGDVYLTENDALFTREIVLNNLVINPNFPPSGGEFTIKIRSAAKHALCTAEPEANRIRVRFSKPERAAAPGQTAVLYDGDMVVCSGLIETAEY